MFLRINPYNEISPSVIIRTNLEGIVLSEITHTEKDQYHMVALICGVQKQDKMKQTNKTKQANSINGEQSDGCQKGDRWEDG